MYRLLQVPALRAKYAGYIRDIAEKWLDWKTLGPLAQQFQSVIAADIKLDTRKLDTTENFGERRDHGSRGTGGRRTRRLQRCAAPESEGLRGSASRVFVEGIVFTRPCI